MADPLTLSVLGGAVLTQGITFIYGQAGELLRKRRERREKGTIEPDQLASAEVPVLEGAPAPLVADLDVLERVGDEIADLRRALSDYVDGIKPVTAADRELMAMTDALRGLLEAVYGQRFTFRGEDRESSGPVVSGSINVEAVLGKATAVRVRRLSGAAKVQANAKANRVEAGGEFSGVEVDEISG